MMLGGGTACSPLLLLRCDLGFHKDSSCRCAERSSCWVQVCVYGGSSSPFPGSISNKGGMGCGWISGAIFEDCWYRFVIHGIRSDLIQVGVTGDLGCLEAAVPWSWRTVFRCLSQVSLSFLFEHSVLGGGGDELIRTHCQEQVG